MNTRNMLVVAKTGRPDTLALSAFQRPLGVSNAYVTYQINGVPIDVPPFEVVRFARAALDCRPSPVGHYTVDWATLVLSHRR